MSVKRRTIDNLGVDASIRYAKDAELFEPRLIEESHLVAQKSEIPTIKPYVPSEFDQLFAMAKTSVWASFLPPAVFFSARSLFTFQLIPSLGEAEEQEALEDALNKEEQKEEGGGKREQEREEEEKKKLRAFFECLRKFNKALELINSRRNQYQKG